MMGGEGYLSMCCGTVIVKIDYFVCMYFLNWKIEKNPSEDSE